MPAPLPPHFVRSPLPAIAGRDAARLCSNLPHAFCLPLFAAIFGVSSVCDARHMPAAFGCAAFLRERMKNIFTLI